MDQEKHIVMDLRTNHNMNWSAIAAYLNQERRNRGEPETHTESSAYGVFVRHSPRIAALNSEQFNPHDYVLLRHPKMHVDQAYKGDGSCRGTKRSRSQERNDKRILRDAMSHIRKPTELDKDASELDTLEKSEMLRKSVGVVERKYWSFVADEMERLTGKYYDCRALESRYKELGK